MDNNFGMQQISKFIDNVSLFDGKEEAAQAYAEKVNGGQLDNLAGYNVADYKANMAKVVEF